MWQVSSWSINSSAIASPDGVDMVPSLDVALTVVQQSERFDGM